MIELVINARKASIAPGMDVQRILPFRKRRMVGPFIFMDHAGPVQLDPDKNINIDVLPHPHIGLSTVSYLLGGKVTHRDSLGVEQIIQPGEVNWMTAGKGIAHSERFEDPTVLANGKLELIQSWVALPKEAEETDPAFENYQPSDLPVYTDTGVWMRLIAGQAYGLQNQVKTHSPLFYLHVVMDVGGRFGLPQGHSERGVYIVKGQLEIGGRRYDQGQMVVFNQSADPIIRATEQSVLMVMGGEPLGHRYIWWNFVSSSRERIEQAKADWKAGRFELPPNDNSEFVPLPENKGKLKTKEDPEPDILS